MYKTKSKTNEHGEHVYDSPAIGKASPLISRAAF